jgi:hypothetical protein
MPVESSLDNGVFGPEATAAMGEAFDAACNELHIADQPNGQRELIAILIIAAARRGELDPVCLQMVALTAFATARRGVELLPQSPGRNFP